MSVNAKTGIEWSDATWNCLSGCKECDPGCVNCYAKNVAQRMADNPNEKIRAKYLPVVKNHQWTEEVTITEKEFAAPLRTPKSKKIFVNSMSDLFYEKVEDKWIDRHLLVMSLAKWHFFQVLTKRQKRLKSYFENLTQERLVRAHEWLIDTFGLNARTVGSNINFNPQLMAGMKNVIWCVSASDQRGVDLRVPALLETPYIAYRGISLEPLVSCVELEKYLNPDSANHKLDWVIVGGESAKLSTEKVRPLHPSNVTKVVNDCRLAQVPVFFKQWGDWLPVAAPKIRYLGDRILADQFGNIQENISWIEAIKSNGVDWAFEKHGKNKNGNELFGQKIEEHPVIKVGEYINYWRKNG